MNNLLNKMNLNYPHSSSVSSLPHIDITTNNALERATPLVIRNFLGKNNFASMLLNELTYDIHTNPYFFLAYLK